MPAFSHRRSATFGPGGRFSRAFTLIEILVVLVIIAVISAVALLTLGFVGDDRELQTEARRLTSLIQLANDEAAVLGRDYGLEFGQTGYRFVEFDPLLNRWHEIIGDDVLRPRQLVEGMEFELELEDRRVQLDSSLAELELPDVDDEGGEEDKVQIDSVEIGEDDSDLNDDYAPHILIMSSGDVSPFELKILRPSDRSELTMVMSLAGELEIEDDADERG